MHLRRGGYGPFIFAGPVLVSAQNGAADPQQKAFTPAPISPADSLNAVLSIDEQELVGAAEAMPAEKYDFAPPESAGNYKGVRTFGQQVKHVAEANYLLLGRLGENGVHERAGAAAVQVHVGFGCRVRHRTYDGSLRAAH